MRAPIPLLSIALLLAGCGLARPVAPTSTASLRVATYNLNYGLAGDAETIAAIEATDADVLVLQEVSDGWARAISEQLASRWPHACVATSEWPAGGGAILSRHPLRDCARSPSPVGWFPALAATVASPLGATRIVNVHLRPARSGAAVIADLTELPAEHRREVATHLARLSDPSLPTIVAGDFNEGDDEGGGLSELASGYRSALAERAPDATTWRWPLLAMQLEKRLDHILYDRRALRCTSARVLHAGRSDHYPVVARFALAEPEPMPIGTSMLYGRTSALTPRR